MRRFTALVLLGSLPGSLAAQNFVSNGDFAAGLAPWVETGFSFNPTIETWDVTGLGASQCYACSPGGQVSPPPYLPNSIKQQVIAIPGVPQEFSMDIVIQQANAGNNADAGTLWVQLGGQEIARLAFGNYTSLETARARLTSRFVYTGPAGMQDLEIFLHRTYLCAASTPRSRIDNISLSIAAGPVFVWNGRRKLGRTSTIGAQGDASAPHVFMISLGRTTGVTLPPVQGLVFLDLTSAVTMFSGVFDSQGANTFPFAVPANPALSSLVVFVQGMHVVTGQFLAGTDQFLNFTP